MGGARSAQDLVEHASVLPHARARPGRGQLRTARLAVGATILAWFGLIATAIDRELTPGSARGLGSAVAAAAYLVIITLFTASALAYLTARFAFLARLAEHRPIGQETLSSFFAKGRPTVTALVPSFREDARVIRKALLSAVLQDYGNVRVVLLIDDPPDPTTPTQRELLQAARELPAEIEALLTDARACFEPALTGLRETPASPRPANADEVSDLAEAYGSAAAWMERLAASEQSPCHADHFFAERVLGPLAHQLAATATALRADAIRAMFPSRERLAELARRLEGIFAAEVRSFERKRYVSLSPEANKAMNLNGYLALMGGSYREEPTAEGLALLPTSNDEAEITVPDADYVLTLDADSVLLPEYVLRLVYLLEQPDYARVAVAQTPYSAFPGAATRLEQIAGASTDVRFVFHQGMSRYGAAFWVGANAILRKRALEEIVRTDEERGWPISRYVQDRTVIEDTESTIDLTLGGWTLFNYPERLTYSETPPDFGALCIQRRRWANGGLLIVPNLVRYLRARRRQGKHVGVLETWLRFHYLASITWNHFGLVLLLVIPYDSSVLLPFVVLGGLPQVLAMASDLKRCGYRRGDVARVYALNLVLVPVNIAGVLRSLVQGITGRKSAFGRTPKVRNRTAAALPFVLIPYFMIGLCLALAIRSALVGAWPSMVLVSLNGALTAYGVVAYVGLRASFDDVRANFAGRAFTPGRRIRETEAPRIPA